MSGIGNAIKFFDVCEEILRKKKGNGEANHERERRRPRPEQFEAVGPPPVPPAQWCDNSLFTAGYPVGWFETTPTEPPIEGSLPVLVLRRSETTGIPDDLGTRGVIRCFPSGGSITVDEFLDSAAGMAEARARALRAALVDPERFLMVDGAYCMTFQVEGKQQIRAFQSVPSAITEVLLLHADQLLMMQLESDPQCHEEYRQTVGTVLGTLSWK